MTIGTFIFALVMALWALKLECSYRNKNKLNKYWSQLDDETEKEEDDNGKR